jgi:diaminopimelate epimerase
MRKIHFFKYHGLGNDFIIIDLIITGPRRMDFGRLAQEICHRHTGVGADGLLVLMKSTVGDCRIDLYNSDGSWAEKSGNGLRCAAAYFHNHHCRRRKSIFESGCDVAEARIIRKTGDACHIRVSIGKPTFRTAHIPMRSGNEFHVNMPIRIGTTSVTLTALSVGNPHAVIFVKHFNFDWQALGKVVERCRYFPRRTNVEFVKIVNRNKIILNDWERGAGATGSSGTGASAAAAAGVINGFLDRQVEVVFPTGSLFIDWSDADDSIYLTGPAEFVCSGDYTPRRIKP